MESTRQAMLLSLPLHGTTTTSDLGLIFTEFEEIQIDNITPNNRKADFSTLEPYTSCKLINKTL